MKRATFYHNTDKCIGCKTCIIACKDKNNLQPGRKYRRVANLAGGRTTLDETANTLNPEKVFAYSISLSCNHCAKPACLENCPVQAIKKRADGIVYINTEACIGCQACVTVCPYGVPSYDPEVEKTSKCDMCMDLIDAGEKTICESTCPMRCIEVGDYDTLKTKYARETINLNVKPLPVSTDTDPSLLLVPHRDLKYRDDAKLICMPEELEASYHNVKK